jgi:hypothetical protein
VTANILKISIIPAKININHIQTALKREKRGKWRGIALCNDEKGVLNGMISLVIEVICIIYSKSIRYYGERKRRS